MLLAIRWLNEGKLAKSVGRPDRTFTTHLDIVHLHQVNQVLDEHHQFSIDSVCNIRSGRKTPGTNIDRLKDADSSETC